jgi:adenylate cyclase
MTLVVLRELFITNTSNTGVTVERRLAAIVLTDVVGYSRLVEIDEAGTLETLRSHRADLIDPKIEQYGGRIVKTMGDGLLLEFHSVVNAVGCAIEIQQGMMERNAELPDTNRIVFRVGINLGDIVIDGEDIHGDGVNVAARLESISTAGGLAISGVAHESLGSLVDAVFEDAGEHTLKNISRPVRVWRWTPDESDLKELGATDAPIPSADKPSIAVLPFANLSGDPEQDYFANGLAEDLITALSRQRWLFVIARNSSFSVKATANEVGTRFGVRYVLEGSVRKAADRIRVAVRLIETETGAHIWAERFDRNFEDIFELQDEISIAVASAIEPEIRAVEIARSERKPTNSLDAYDLVLRAYPHVWAGTPSDSTAARDYLNKAILLDANYAEAHALMGLVNLNEAMRQSDLATFRNNLLTMCELAEAAVRLDDHHPFARQILAFARGFTDRRPAEGAVRLADDLRKHPNSAVGWGFAGWLECYAGNPAAALGHVQRAMALSPLDPMRIYWLTAKQMAFFVEERFEDSIAVAKTVMERSAEASLNRRYLAAALAHLGRREEAAKAMKRVLELSPGLTAKLIREVTPYEHAHDLERYAGGLELAGLPS